jgi:ABC-type nitrate/sulfonate/bicarbonate transport system substrate-binding protein
VSNADYKIDTIWYTRCPVPTPLGLAAQLGWIKAEFEPDGFAIRTLEESSDLVLRESYFDHHLSNSFRQGGNVPAIWARAGGRATRVLGLNWVDESQLIVTLPDSGIKTPKDLRGRRLALPKYNNLIDHRRAGALRGFIVALELGGLTYKDVEFIDLCGAPFGDGGSTMLHGNREPRSGGYTPEIYALIRREVDAIYLKGAHGAQLARQLSTHVVTDIRNHPDPLVRTNNAAPRPLTVDQDLLDNRPDIAARFLARVVAVGRWAKAHPSEAVAYVAREAHTTEAWARHAYGNDLFRRMDTSLDDAAIAGLDAYKQFLFQWGFLKQDFDVWQWIDSEPMANIHKYAGKQTA